MVRRTIKILVLGVCIGFVTAKKVDKLSKKYRLVIKFERKEHED